MRPKNLWFTATLANFKRRKANPKHDSYLGWTIGGRIAHRLRRRPVDTVSPLPKAIEEAGFNNCGVLDAYGYPCTASEPDHDGSWAYNHFFQNK